MIKLAWDTGEFVDGKLSGAAFRKDEILGEIDPDNGLPKFVSVDRRDVVNQVAVDNMISMQTDGDKVEKLNRNVPMFAQFVCGDVRTFKYEEDLRRFEVTPDPIAGHPVLPDNPAHCGIHNISGKVVTGKGPIRQFVDQLRAELLGLVRTVLTYSDVFPEEP